MYEIIFEYTAPNHDNDKFIKECNTIVLSTDKYEEAEKVAEMHMREEEEYHKYEIRKIDNE